ncbi:NUDIX domain-containing protein [Kribbella sp. NPDC006257]|uniref:NUDIX hydrolase n=1 Tax=Kribbella sp. NPDC006257 TaxID=3156738 RepID=UPI0033AC7503
MAVNGDARQLLQRWSPPFDQRELREEALALISSEAALWREGAPAHLTASAVVLDRSGRQVLLVHHAKSGKWQFPGGHCERNDASLEAAARREVREATGLAVGLMTLLALDGGPTMCGPSARRHIDVRFVAIVSQDAPRVSSESLDVGWLGSRICQPLIDQISESTWISLFGEAMALA